MSGFEYRLYHLVPEPLVVQYIYHFHLYLWQSPCAGPLRQPSSSFFSFYFLFFDKAVMDWRENGRSTLEQIVRGGWAGGPEPCRYLYLPPALSPVGKSGGSFRLSLPHPKLTRWGVVLQSRAEQSFSLTSNIPRGDQSVRVYYVVVLIRQGLFLVPVRITHSEKKPKRSCV